MTEISFCLTPSNFPKFIRAVYNALDALVATPTHQTTHEGAWNDLVATGATTIIDLDETLNIFDIEKNEVDSTENISNIIQHIRSRLPILDSILTVGTITCSNKLNVTLATENVTATPSSDPQTEPANLNTATPIGTPMARDKESHEGFHVPSKNLPANLDLPYLIQLQQKPPIRIRF